MISGDKIILRAIEATDAERCHAWVNDAEVTRYLSLRFPLSMGQERKWVEQERDPGRELQLAIEAHDGVHIGTCGLFRMDHVARCAELGMMIGDKPYWGKGYGTDAMLTLCGFGFCEMNLHRIWLQVFDENRRAIACYEKSGFRHEGVQREAEFKHGRYHDILVMGMLQGEYPSPWPRAARAEG